MFISNVAQSLVTDGTPGLRRMCDRPRRRSGQEGMGILLLNNELTEPARIAVVLAEAGNDVVRSDTVAQALTFLRTRAFAAIVVDMRPDLVGYEAVRILRTAGILLPVLFISARTTPDAYRLALSSGANTVSALPLDHDGLQVRLESLFDPGSIDQDLSTHASFPVASRQRASRFG